MLLEAGFRVSFDNVFFWEGCGWLVDVFLELTIKFWIVTYSGYCLGGAS